MPHIVVDLPEPKADPLLKQLMQQFLTMQRRLQTTKKRPDASMKALQAVLKQQDGLMKAMERMVTGMVKGGTSTTALQTRLGKMEKAVLASKQGMRNRTFGSNF